MQPPECGPVPSAECSCRYIRLLSRVERRHEMRHDGDGNEENGGVGDKGDGDPELIKHITCKMMPRERTERVSKGERGRRK